MVVNPYQFESEEQAVLENLFAQFNNKLLEEKMKQQQLLLLYKILFQG